MFGLSMGKILLLLVVVVAVWYGFRRLGRWSRAREAARTTAAPNTAKDARARPGTEDLVPCAVCGTYAPSPLANCPSGRNDCPLLESRV